MFHLIFCLIRIDSYVLKVAVTSRKLHPVLLGFPWIFSHHGQCDLGFYELCPVALTPCNKLLTQKKRLKGQRHRSHETSFRAAIVPRSQSDH